MPSMAFVYTSLEWSAVLALHAARAIGMTGKVSTTMRMVVLTDPVTGEQSAGDVFITLERIAEADHDGKPA